MTENKKEQRRFVVQSDGIKVERPKKFKKNHLKQILKEYKAKKQ